MPDQPSTPIEFKPRINALAQYMMALAAVISAYSLYAKFAVPAIEGPPSQIVRRTATPIADLPVSGGDKTHLIPLLPADAWELTDCKTLLTESGTILFKEILYQDDGSMKVVPFTMMSGLESEMFPKSDSKQQTKKSESPTILRCITGATLKFNKPAREVFSGGAKLEIARLTERVDIYRPPSGPNQNDALHVLTSNVQVDKHSIRTLDKVEFSYGPNQGSGRNMLIGLLHETNSQSAADFSNVTGVRRLELAFLDKLRIQPSNRKSNIAATKAVQEPVNETNNSKQLFSNSKSPLEISCDGAFVFDFETKTALFQKNVVAVQDDAFRDNIHCEKLTMVFADKPKGRSDLTSNPVLTPTSNSEDTSKTSSAIKLNRFIAEGAPAVIVSRSKSAKITGDYLSYNMNLNRVDGRSNKSSNRMVTIVSPEYQMAAKQLDYVIPEDGSLGPTNVTGPGHLLQVGNKDQKEFFATWSTGLTINSVPEQLNLQRIVLDGEPKIRIANETRVDSDQLDLLVWQIPTQSEQPNGTLKRSWTFEPSKLVATGHVSIVTPKLEGNAKSLTATWPSHVNTISQITSPIQNSHVVAYRGTFRPQSETRQNHFVVENTTFQRIPQSKSTFVEQARDNSVQLANFQPNPLLETTPKTKLKFRGDTVDVRLVGSGSETEIKDLAVVGDVSVTRVPLNPAGTNTTTKQDLEIKGHRLQLTPQAGQEMYRALISGKNTTSTSPTKLASIVTNGMELTGQNINLDQAANKIWVEGAGSMQFLAQDLKPGSNQNLTTGKTLPQNVNIAWAGGMVFDGTKMYFEQNVAMAAGQILKNGNTSKLKSTSEGLSIELKQSVNFQNLQGKKNRNKFEIRELVAVERVSESKQVFKMAKHTSQTGTTDLSRPVVIENRTFDKTGKLIEQQRITVPQAIFSADNQSISSKGPGTVATHQIAKSDGDKSNPFGQLSESTSGTGLTFIRFNFDDSMKIDSERREMKLSGNIRTIYAPATDWQQTFDPDQVQKRTPGNVFLTCDQFQMAQWAPRGQQKPSNEMLAEGNAHILSETFEATADRVSYHQATDKLVIEGTPRNDANLWFKQTPHDKAPTHLVAAKIHYGVKDKSTQTEGVKNLNINRN